MIRRNNGASTRRKVGDPAVQAAATTLGTTIETRKSKRKGSHPFVEQVRVGITHRIKRRTRKLERKDEQLQHVEAADK